MAVAQTVQVRPAQQKAGLAATLHLERSAQAPCGEPAYLTLIQRCVLCLLEDHTEGDALGVGGEDPTDGEACLGHGDGDDTVGTGPHEQLPVALPKVGDLVHRER